MQKYTIKKGTTSKIIMIDIYDSSSTVGARLAGLVYNTASLSAYYNREGAAGAATAITLATATKGTWATGGFIAIDATNMPGHYELHIPDAALATGANSVMVELKGAANMVPKTILIELVDNVEADTYAIANHATYGNAQLNTDLDTLLTRIVGTLLTGNHNPQTGDGFARLGAPVGASISADVAGVQADTDNLQTRIPTALVGGRIDASIGAVAANAITAAGIADGAIDRATFAADTGMQNIRAGTAQAGAAASITLDASASAVDSFYNECWVYITGGTGAGQTRAVTAYVGATKVATITPNWTTVPDATSTFAVMGVSRNSLTQAFPTNFASLSITAAGLVDITQAAADKVWSTAARTLTSFGTLIADIWANAARTITGGTVTTNSDKTGYSLSSAGIQAIWDALTSALTTVGSIGKLLVDNINATISSRSSHTAADVWSVATRTLTSFGTLVSDVWANATRTLTTNSGIKKNTALNNFEFFMRLTSDHVTGGTGLTVTATRSIDGAVFAACANAVVEVANGIYKINLAATDLNGDVITLKFTSATADATMVTIITVA